MFVIARVRLATDTRPIQTKTGTAMRSGFGFADVDAENGLPVGLVAFGSLADELGKYRKGDIIRVTGTFKANDYTKRDGTEVNGWQITLDGLMGVRAAKGKYSTPRAKRGQGAAADANKATGRFYDDEVSF